MTEAAPAVALPALVPEPPSAKALAIRKVLLVAMWASFGAAVVVATIYAIAGFDGGGLFAVAALIVVGFNLLTWRWVAVEIDRAPTAGRRAAIIISATIIMALLSVAAVFILILLSLFVLGWSGA